MKALAVATMLVLALVSGIIFWALANDTPLAGEPTVLLQIKKDEPHKKIAQTAEISRQDDRELSGGRAQVLLDILPPGAEKSRDMATSGGQLDNGLLEQSKFGPLPKRGKDGRSPAVAYARIGTGQADATPRIAILVVGLGLNKRLSQRVVKKLPAEITLAISPYGRELGELAGEARRLGHEVMLQVPMEPIDYPESDTGPKTLLVAKSIEENNPRLRWSLGRFTGYFAVVNVKGERYLADKSAASGLFKELQRRGLLFFRDHSGGGEALAGLAEQVGLGYSQATLQIDAKPSASGVRASLLKLEEIARRSGLAVGVAHMHPVSINMISKWAKKLEGRGMRLVPVSAAYGKQ